MENADEQNKTRPVRASKKDEGRREREESGSHRTTPRS